MRTAIVGGGAAGFFLAINLKELMPAMEVTIFAMVSQAVLTFRPLGPLPMSWHRPLSDTKTKPYFNFDSTRASRLSSDFRLRGVASVASSLIP